MAVYSRSETLSFRCSATSETLSEALDEQRTRGEFCDVRFVVHGETLVAHRAVLSARSQYFHTMFTSNFQEIDQGDIDMTHVFSTPQQFQEILNYMYRGSITISGDTFEEILNGASHFLMERLRLTCAQYMISNLGPSNCLRIWAIADRYNLDNVAVICKAMAKSRFHDCIRYKQETLEMPAEFLKVAIKEGILDLLQVEEKLRFLRRWLDNNIKAREFVFKEILQELLSRDSDSNQRLSLLFNNITQKSYLNVMKMVDYTLSGLQVRTPLIFPIVGLVGVLKEKLPQTGMYLNRVIAFIPGLRRWVILGSFEHDHTIMCKQLVGFVRHCAVFKGGDSERVVLVDLLRGTCEELPDVPWGSIDRIGPLPQFFCFDETVFCVVDWGNTCSLKKTSSNINLGSSKSSGSKVNHPRSTEAAKGSPSQGSNSKDSEFFVNRRLFKLDVASRSWSEVCDLPLSNGSALHLMRYQQRQQAGKVFIWAGQRKAASQGSAVSPGWMCLVREGYRYNVIPLAPPETDPLNGRAVTLSGTGHKIVVSSMSSVSSQRVYDIREDHWTTQSKEKYVKPPCLETLPLENNAVTTVEMPGLSSYLATDCLYNMDISSPCISRLLAYNLVGPEKKWSELPPPPTERVTKYVACHLPAVVMMSAKPASYLDENVEEGQGPLFHYTLEGCGTSEGHFRSSVNLPHHLAPSAVDSGHSSSGDSSPRHDDIQSKLCPSASRHGSISPSSTGFSFHFY